VAQHWKVCNVWCKSVVQLLGTVFLLHVTTDKENFDNFKIVLFYVCKLKIAPSTARIYLNLHFNI